MINRHNLELVKMMCEVDLGPHPKSWEEQYIAEQARADRDVSVATVQARLDALTEPDYLYVLVVYGHGGWNRWMFYSDDSVKLSKSHASQASLQRAKDLGFDLH